MESDYIIPSLDALMNRRFDGQINIQNALWHLSAPGTGF